MLFAEAWSSDRASADLLLRLDRIGIWALPVGTALALGLGFFFAFYDEFEIAVSFTQTCTQIVATCLPEPKPGHVPAATMLGPAGAWNLIGYVVGAIWLGPLADRLGRRPLLTVAMLLTGIGSFLSALVNDYSAFVATRALTGAGIGTMLAVVTTYVSEVSPAALRARNAALFFTMSGLGGLIAVWGGLLLTTPSAPFPMGLDFALAGPTFPKGWRILYEAGAAIAVIGPILPALMPESPRWLIARGKFDQAERVIALMAGYAASRGDAGVRVDAAAVANVKPHGALGYGELLGRPLYHRRLLVMFGVWFAGYAAVYCYAAGFTSTLASLGSTSSEAGLIATVGVLGFLACGPIVTLVSERIERKMWLRIAAVITLAGGAIVALAPSTTSDRDSQFVVECIGAICNFFGLSVWVPMTYLWSTENFPTRARATGFALVDGMGHFGGIIGPLVILPLLPSLELPLAIELPGSFLVVAALIAEFGIPTRFRTLEELAP